MTDPTSPPSSDPAQPPTDQPDAATFGPSPEGGLEEGAAYYGAHVPTSLDLTGPGTQAYEPGGLAGRPVPDPRPEMRFPLSSVRSPADWGGERFDPRPLESRLTWARLVELLRGHGVYLERMPADVTRPDETTGWHLVTGEGTAPMLVTDDEADLLRNLLAGNPAPPDLQPPAPPSVWSSQVVDHAHPGLPAAIGLLADVLGRHDADTPSSTWPAHDQDELGEAADALGFVFHQRPVEGWHWTVPGRCPVQGCEEIAAHMHPLPGQALAVGTPRAATAADQDAVATAERLMQAERLAHDVIQETGGSLEWHAVVSELLDHLTGGLKMKISTPCPPLNDSSSVDRDPEVSAQESGAPEGSSVDDPTTAAARPLTDRPVHGGYPGATIVPGVSHREVVEVLDCDCSACRNDPTTEVIRVRRGQAIQR